VLDEATVIGRFKLRQIDSAFPLIASVVLADLARRKEAGLYALPHNRHLDYCVRTGCVMWPVNPKHCATLNINRCYCILSFHNLFPPDFPSLALPGQ
jgi:hypothetical protein